ncbi:hypothetical protein BraRD5C2_68040 [Bradyrhizobium sp. RD5-C2]|nr:hypothetical protein BraRD5C2_68040 [Bradyrhizobium sp. RD5-C2]
MGLAAFIAERWGVFFGIKSSRYGREHKTLSHRWMPWPGDDPGTTECLSFEYVDSHFTGAP